MARPKKEPSHDVYSIDGRKVEKSEMVHDGDQVQVIIPKNTPYVQVRRALEIALLRVR